MAIEPGKDYQEASFRGAVFHVPDDSAKLGRRLVGHVYPGLDLPYTEDMGRKPRGFSLTAFVLGENYKQARDALIAACEEEGPGELVHPWLGKHTVTCEGCTVRHSTSELMQVSFQLEFQEAGERNYPATEKDYAYQVADQTSQLKTTAGQVFQSLYSVVGPAWLQTAASGDIKSALALVKGVVQVMPGPLDAAASAEFMAKVEAIAQQVDQAVSNPETLVSEVIAAALEGLGALTKDSGTAVTASVNLAQAAGDKEKAAAYGVTLSGLADTPTTPLRRQQAQNQKAVIWAVKDLALSEAVTAAVSMDFTSWQDARDTRDKLLDALEDRILEAGESSDDAGVQSMARLEALRSTVIGSFSQELASLPKLKQVTPHTVMPLAVLSYDLYQDLDRMDEMAARNGVINPCLPQPGQALRVLES